MLVIKQNLYQLYTRTKKTKEKKKQKRRQQTIIYSEKIKTIVLIMLTLSEND